MNDNTFLGTILDIGMNDGKDTLYYASRGYKVIAYEANPELCTFVKQKLNNELTHIDIRNKAISDEVGSLDFYVNKFNSTWSSLDKGLGNRREGSNLISVSSCRLDEELKDVDDIFFAKIDIEGFDIVALRQILRLRNLPMYVSIENGNPKILDLFAGAGYKKFKLSNQKYIKYQKIPLNSLHGNLVDHQFLSGSSGLWGEDLDGRWFPYDEMMLALKSIGEARKLTPNNVFAEIIGWFDLHACRDN